MCTCSSIHFDFGWSLLEQWVILVSESLGTLTRFPGHTQHLQTLCGWTFLYQLALEDHCNIHYPGSCETSLPSSSYLELHAACCRVANLSGADEYVDTILSEMEDIYYLIGAFAGWHFYFDMRSRPGVRKFQSTFSPLWVIRFPFHPYNLLHCNLHEIRTFSLLTDVVRPFWPTNFGFYLTVRQMASGPTSAFKFRALELLTPTYYQDIVRYIITTTSEHEPQWKDGIFYLPFACFSFFHKSLCKHLLVYFSHVFRFNLMHPFVF